MDLTYHDTQITVVPYIRGVAEYAQELRSWFTDHKNEDFFVAVDLPHGIEPEVLRAVKRLPAISLIVDPLKRAIPIIPTCASVEAVRSFLENGLDYAFIDTSLPVSGSSEDWSRLLTLCNEIGEKETFEHAEEHGIDLNRLICDDPSNQGDPLTLFELLPSGLQYQRPDGKKACSSYRDARDSHMGAKLVELAAEYRHILFVCENTHVNSVISHLDDPPHLPGDSITVPTLTCRVQERDIYKISREIPYFLYNYELYRDTEWSREQWILNLLAQESTEKGIDVQAVYQYSRNLGLADGDMLPGLYNILVSAKSCAGDHYALQVLRNALSYPPADSSSNCEITFYRDYDLEPIRGQRILSLTGDDPASEWWKKSRDKREKRKMQGVKSFVRTPSSLDEERRFMNYLTEHFVDPAAIDEYHSEPFLTGLEGGLDIRETLRHYGSGALYIKEPDVLNTAAYVVHFGGTPDWRVFFDTRNPLVGAATRGESNRHCWVCFIAFSTINEPMESLLDLVDLTHPLRSCLEIALAHARNVFLFTENFSDEVYFEEQMWRIKVLSLQKIPARLLKEMWCFEILR